MLDEKDALFAAYVAGFDSSGEGFNGEYVNVRFRGEGVLERHLRPRFEEWFAERAPKVHE